MKQYHLPLPLREAMSADDFMIADSNREAVTWIVEREPSAWAGHCLILYGPPGCGKTHLLRIWQEKHKARLLELGENVTDEIVGGRAAYKALALDDADRIAGNPEHEEWLQHLYNATQAAHMPLLLTASAPPAQWSLKLKDIESRLKSCPAIELREPNDDLMRGMLMKQFSDRQLLVDTEVIEYLASRLERTGVAVRETVNLLDQAALEAGRKITVPFVQEVINVNHT
jgi:DnaA regulatory inactivator Hda